MRSLIVVCLVAVAIALVFHPRGAVVWARGVTVFTEDLLKGRDVTGVARSALLWQPPPLCIRPCKPTDANLAITDRAEFATDGPPFVYEWPGGWPAVQMMQSPPRPRGSAKQHFVLFFCIDMDANQLLTNSDATDPCISVVPRQTPIDE